MSQQKPNSCLKINKSFELKLGNDYSKIDREGKKLFIDQNGSP